MIQEEVDEDKNGHCALMGFPAGSGSNLFSAVFVIALKEPLCVWTPRVSMSSSALFCRDAFSMWVTKEHFSWIKKPAFPPPAYTKLWICSQGPTVTSPQIKCCFLLHSHWHKYMKLLLLHFNFSCTPVFSRVWVKSGVKPLNFQPEAAWTSKYTRGHKCSNTECREVAFPVAHLFIPRVWRVQTRAQPGSCLPSSLWGHTHQRFT